KCGWRGRSRVFELPTLSGSYMHRTAGRDAQQALAHRFRIGTWIALLAMFPLVMYFTTRGSLQLSETRVRRELEHSHFFAAQADARLRGRLDVDPEQILGECFISDGRCYGYFGVTPSLLRLPLYVRGRWFRSGMTPIYLGLALLLAYWAALQLLQRSLIQFADPALPRGLLLGYFVATALALGPGSTLLFLARPAVYEEAAAWSVTFLMLALNSVWAWQSTGKRRSLIFAIVFGIAAANSKPTSAMACGVLGLVVA